MDIVTTCASSQLCAHRRARPVFGALLTQMTLEATDRNASHCLIFPFRVDATCFCHTTDICNNDDFSDVWNLMIARCSAALHRLNRSLHMTTTTFKMVVETISR